MADGMHMHHIYHAACAVLKKLWETDLPREALRLVNYDQLFDALDEDGKDEEEARLGGWGGGR